MNLSKNLFFVFVFYIFYLIPYSAQANTINCGLKIITVNGNEIIKIVHEDGTVHTGSSVSNNWKFDGKAIKHRLDDKPILCGNKPKSRDEIIKELSGRFSENPKIYGMSKQEAKMMGDYTSKLMKTDSSCYLLVDAAKDSSQKDAFFIDCNDKQSKTRRYWVTGSDLKSAKLKNAAFPVSSSEAIQICNKELKARTTNPSTYDPSLILGAKSTAVERTGRNVVTIEFKAANSFGVVGNHDGRCILESGKVIEVIIKNK